MSLTSLMETGRLPLIVDVGMVISLLSLSFWTGTMANRIDNHAAELTIMRGQLGTLSVNTNAAQITLNTAEIAVLKERSVAQQAEMIDMRNYLGTRLDRIERKIDNGK